MKEQFLTYEQALELKELGFDEPCLGYYNTDPYLKSPVFNMVKPFEHEWCLPAPLYQQAFRWFRDKHNLIGVIEYIGGATPKTTWWDIYVVGHFNIKTEGWTMKYQPYEEAELACLKKLIEIVKNK